MIGAELATKTWIHFHQTECNEKNRESSEPWLHRANRKMHKE
jgi:hypothetical protein